MKSATGTKQGDGLNRDVSDRRGQMRLVDASILPRPVAKSRFNICEDVFPQGVSKTSALDPNRVVMPDEVAVESSGVGHSPISPKDANGSHLLVVAGIAIAGVIGFLIGRNRQ